MHYNASVGSIPMHCILLDFLVIEFSANEAFECKTVFTEFTACRFAGKPTKRSPCFVNAPTDGVVRVSFVFLITWDVLLSVVGTWICGAQINANDRLGTAVKLIPNEP